jgi:hypothetical protein
MNQRPKPRKPPNPHSLIIRVNAKIDGWKSLAKRHFDASPPINRGVFEKEWPEILANFLFVETIGVARALKPIFEGYEN